MILNQLNPTSFTKVEKLNKLLSEQFGIKVTPGKASKKKLVKIRENADMALVKLRNSNRQFQLEPEYAKFLGIRDVIDTMLNEGMYPESRSYNELREKIKLKCAELMDKGYTQEEACSETMNQVRLDSSHCYEDSVTKPMVMAACMEYVEENCAMESVLPETDMNERLLSELAKEVGVELENLESYDAIEEKLNMFAQVSGKSRDAVVGFLNGLEEDALTGGIQMFGKKIGEQNKFTGARKDAIAQGQDSFEVDGKQYTVSGDTKDEKKQDAKESMFDDILNDMISEDVDVEQAEVVMAVRALADDIQTQVERISDMMNKDVPAIADQMRAEMGAGQSQTFVDTVSGLLAGHLDACKGVKAGLDAQVGGLTGEEMTGGLGDTGLGDTEMGMDDELGGPQAEPGLDDMGIEEPVDNIPAAAGPENEPLGRAPVEV
jgi:hypothetical protein